MPVTEQERIAYFAVVKGIVERLGSVDFDPETIVWHYTTGSSLISIIESGELFTTQVACLNDSTEILYASRLFREAMLQVQQERASDEDVVKFVSSVLESGEEDPNNPRHSPSKYFVTCFTTARDDLSQWRAYSEPGGENGYAIGLVARGLFVGPNSVVAKVNYDQAQHRAAAKTIAEATVNFYFEGLKRDGRESNPSKWTDEFFRVWDDNIYRLAALVKDPGFEAEHEFRICHEMQEHEVHQVRFRQKKTLMARYMPLRFPVWMRTRRPMLPIVSVLVGPSRQRQISRVTVRTLLQQLGYENVPVEVSALPLQSP